jgi:methylenetetrahydrofolate dehydrogenase (NADP+) / methenyltetrahydrofolate cyclohydrolase
VSFTNSLPQFSITKETWVDGKKLSGRKFADALLTHLKEQSNTLPERPGLAVILVGNDEASQVYVGGKEKAANSLGYLSRIIRLEAESTQEKIVAEIHALNLDPNIHGILVQLPLPPHLNEEQILQAIVPEKDADGFHFMNQGKLLSGHDTTLPCTPAGITLMLGALTRADKNIELTGRHAVVIGRSNIVGKPMGQLLLGALNMTVTMCHSKTRNLSDFVRSADVLVSATGVRGIVDCTAIKNGSIVIDVGMHRVDGKLTGDLDLPVAAERAAYYTPVPGGVGPMTIAMLLYNTYQNARRLHSATLVA